jgi:hypothetical protein
MLVYIFTTAKSFEYVIVFCCAILFLLIVYITLRQARKLLESYIVEVVDVYGQKVTPDGLRLGNQREWNFVSTTSLFRSFSETAGDSTISSCVLPVFIWYDILFLLPAFLIIVRHLLFIFKLICCYFLLLFHILTLVSLQGA